MFFPAESANTMKSAKNNEKENLLYLYTSIFKNRGGQKEPQSILSLPHESIARRIRGFPVSPPSFPSNSYIPLPPTSSLFSISQKQLKTSIGKGRKGNIHRPSVDKREWSLFGIKLPPPRRGKERKKFIHHW